MEKIPGNGQEQVLVPKSVERKPAIGGYSDNGLAARAKGGTAQGVFFNTIKSARFGSVFNASKLGTSRTR